jgi:protein gp37
MPLKLRGIGIPDSTRLFTVAWIRDAIADCRRHGVAPFHKQWGSYASNPLVTEQGLTIDEVKRIDTYGKGGGLVDGS